jgi:hypothetical protein
MADWPNQILHQADTMFSIKSEMNHLGRWGTVSLSFYLLEQALLLDLLLSQYQSHHVGQRQHKGHEG